MSPVDGRVDGQELDARLNGLRRAAAAARGHLPDEPVRAAEAVVHRAAVRRALAGDLTVVALAGATGAGKSSLFNAIVGEQVSRVAVTRPTTGEPLAALWTTPGAAAALLEWLHVARWHVVDPGGAAGPAPGSRGLGMDGAHWPVAEGARGQQADRTHAPGPGSAGELAGLVLVDLPDHDSTSTDHRVAVDHLVARADVMVWVLDPQKYADALVHEAYLRRFARHAAVTVVVLNQADRLAPEDLGACVAHLRALLADDGLAGARIIPTSAVTGQGIVHLCSVLAQAAQARRAANVRIAADVATAADALSEAAADARAPLRDPSGRRAAELAGALAHAAGVELIQRAIRESVRHQGRMATGWPPLRWLHRLRGDPAGRLRLSREGVVPELVRTSLPSASAAAMAEVTSAARGYARSASAGAPQAWARSAREVAVRAAERIGADLDAAVAGADLSAPRRPRWWGWVDALQWLAVAVAAVGALWLLGLVGLRVLALAAPTPAEVGGLPVPTVLLLAGTVIGLAIAGLAGLLNRLRARRLAAAARARLLSAVDQVARTRIVEPVTAELSTLAEFRIGLVAALGG